MSSPPSLPKDSAIDKAILAIDKLENRDGWTLWSTNIKMALDHTWEYVEGNKASPPGESKPDEGQPDLESWKIGDRNTQWRIWLTLSTSIQQNVFRHAKSPAAVLFKALKDSYEHSGTSTEFYARQKYDNTRISDYDSICDFLTALMNLAYHVNKEIPGSQGWIEDRMIAMCIIHSLPPCMRTLQTILIKSAPSASDMSWNLDDLQKDIDADELCT